MSKYWSETVKNISPYVPGEQPRDRSYIKLNTNESPYPPSPRVIEAIKNAANEELRLYPDPTSDALTTAISNYYQVDKKQVFVGNGSDELLALAFLAYFNPAKPILFPEITYSFYKVYAALFHIDYKLVPLDDAFNIQTEGFFEENGGILLSNPNAPTSKCLSVEVIRSIVEKNMNSVVIVDEAYIDFGGETVIPLIHEYPNLLVIQTLSKSRSLAGLRVGCAIGNKELIEGLDRVKNSINSYTMDRLAQAGAVEAFKDEEYFVKTRDMIIKTREASAEKLRKLGFVVLDSKANFLFVSHPSIAANQLFVKLRENGILVRFFNAPKIDNYLRISIGTDEEMNCLIDRLSMIIKEQEK